MTPVMTEKEGRPWLGLYDTSLFFTESVLHALGTAKRAFIEGPLSSLESARTTYSPTKRGDLYASTVWNDGRYNKALERIYDKNHDLTTLTITKARNISMKEGTIKQRVRITFHYVHIPGTPHKKQIKDMVIITREQRRSFDILKGEEPLIINIDDVLQEIKDHPTRIIKETLVVSRDGEIKERTIEIKKRKR